MKRVVFLLIAGLAVAGPLVGTANAQLVMHEERAWVGPPFPMGDYDEQTVPVLFPTTGYPGPVNPIGGPCFLLPPFATGPLGAPGATLWHTEVDCCAAGAGAPPGWGPTFAAYNSGPAAFNYVTGLVGNAGAISSYGIGAVELRPPGPIAIPGQQIVLCFDYVKITEAIAGDPPGAFDTAFIEVRPAPCGEPAALDPAGIPPWPVLSVLTTPNNVCAAPITCCIGPYHPGLDPVFIGPPGFLPAGGKIRFRFDSHDGFMNAFCGWSVDNVVLTNEECDPPCPATSAFQPQIGSTGGEPISPNPAFALTLSGAAPGSIAFLILGGFNLPQIPLPFPPGCVLCCDPGVLLGPVAVGAAGGAVFPLPIPGGLAPCSPNLCFQWVTLVPAGGAISVYTSSAGKVRIQLG